MFAAAVRRRPGGTAWAACVALVSLGSVNPAVAEPKAANGAPAMDVEQCVAIAVRESAQVEEAEAKLEEFRARMAEVESIYYPKLMGLAFIAPMFTSEFTDITSRKATTKWRRLEHWGPYARVEALLAQPLYTFGRGEAGEAAARERMEVERAALRDTRNIVALEVRRLYHMALYVESIRPVLNTGLEALEEAQKKAQEAYDEGTGEVTQADLMRLRYAETEIKKLEVQAEMGKELALAALKHTMGWPASRELVLADKKLARVDTDTEEPEVANLIARSAELRPEWAQLEHGKKAALAWRDAEALANMPVLFLAGQFEASWTPTRDSSDNPYHQDIYNDLFGGAAIGLQFDLDPWSAAAKADVADATHDQIEALRRFASTGIPMQVRKAHSDVLQFRKMAQLSRDGVKATRKWMAFSAAAFMTGTGEPKDLLEGLAAYLMSKNAEYETLRDYHTAWAELDFAVGRTYHDD